MASEGKIMKTHSNPHIKYLIYSYALITILKARNGGILDLFLGLTLSLFSLNQMEILNHSYFIIFSDILSFFDNILNSGCSINSLLYVIMLIHNVKDKSSFNIYTDKTYFLSMTCLKMTLLLMAFFLNPNYINILDVVIANLLYTFGILYFSSEINNLTDQNKQYSEMIMNIPTGLLVFKKNDNSIYADNKYKLFHANTITKNILNINNTEYKKDNLNPILLKFIKLRNNNLSSFASMDEEKILRNNLYNKIQSDEEDGISPAINTDKYNEYYIHDDNIYAVKIKQYNDNTNSKFKLITFEAINENYKKIQQNMYKNIKYQCLLTVSHELNNPLNGLLHSAEQIVYEKKEKTQDKLIKRMKLSKTLIKFFIKHLMLTIRISSNETSPLVSSCINLEFVFNLMKTKLQSLFDYKNITIEYDYQTLKNLIVSYDYYHFKFLFKTMFIYIYYSIHRGGVIYFKITQEDDEIKIFVKKQNDNSEIGSKRQSKTKIFDTRGRLSIDNSVQTVEMLEDSITKLAELLGIRIEIYDRNSPVYFMICLTYKFERIEENCDSDHMFEFSPVSKKRNIENASMVTRPFKTSGKNVLAGLKDRQALNEEILSRLKERRKTKRVSRKRYTRKGILMRGASITDIVVHPCEAEDRNTQTSIINIMNSTLICGGEESSISNISRSRNMSLFKNIKNLDNLNDTTCNNMKEHFKISMKNHTIFSFSESAHVSPHKKPDYCPTITNDNQLDAQDIDSKSIKKMVLRSSNSLLPIICQCNDILLVDDEPFNLHTMKFLLKRVNLFADTCLNGQESIDKILEKKYLNCTNLNCDKKAYKIIFMDIMMPIMDGIEASKKIQEIVNKSEITPPNIIIVSAHDSEMVTSMIRNINVIKEFVPKPIKKNKVDELLNNYYHDGIS